MYWDSAWVYGPAIFEMIEKGPSLLPGSINPYWNTGHPLLFYFLESLWGSIFGSSVFSLQFFPLLITSALFLGCLWIVQTLFNHWFLTFFMAILLFQPVFLAQSTFVLPEMLLAAFSLASVWFFTHQKFGLYFLSATFLVLTKESGLAIVAGISTTAFIYCSAKNLGSRILNGLTYFSAVLPFLAFISIQKIRLGWFFFPRHFNWISFNINEILHKAYDCSHFVVLEQQRIWIFLGVLCVTYFLNYVRKQNVSGPLWVKIVLMLLDLLFVYACFATFYVWQAILLPLFFVRTFIFFHFQNKSLHGRQNIFVLSLLMCAFAFWGFCVLNFMSLRYLTTLILFVLLLLVVPLYAAKDFSKWSVILLLILLTNQIVAGQRSYYSNKFFDVELSYGRMVQVMTAMVGHVQQELDCNVDVLLTHGQFKEALTRPEIGYQKEHIPFDRERVLINSRKPADYLVISTYEHHPILDSLAALPNTELIHHVEDGAAYSSLYKLP